MNETQKEKTYTALTVKKLKGSEVELKGEIPLSVVAQFQKKALQKIQKDLELPGFRKGHVPEDMARQHIGEQKLLEETAEAALSDAYADIVTDEKLDVVGRPSITITKLAPGNPIGFTITSALYPEVTLPDYIKIAQEKRKSFSHDEDISVTDDEIEKELTRIQGMMTPPKEGEETPEPPALDDAFAKQLGDFTGLSDLKEKMREQLLADKIRKEREKQRLTLAEAVIEKSELEVPALFIEGELEQMVASFTDRVTRVGMKLDDYLTQVGKTMEDLKKEWRPDAEKRAKLQLIFNEIAKKEAIAPDPDRLEREVKHIKEHYPDANEESIRIYTRAQMNNEKVFTLLEGRPTTEDEEHAHTH